MKEATKLLLITLLLIICVNSEVQGTIINAGSCSNSDVQTAVNSANNGDTVTVPAGNCTWSGNVTIPNTKGITLQGAGIDVTTINGGQIFITAASGNLWRVTGFTFSNGSEFLWINGTGTSLRVDHNKFTASGTPAIFIDGPQLYGVIDHNTFTDPTFDFSCIFVFEGMGEDGGDGGAASWARATSLGSENAVYVEDNQFNFGAPSQGYSIVDGRAGGRVVLRYNTVINGTVGWHDAEISGSRGIRQIEVYNNSFQMTSAIQDVVYHRGGTGVWFNNTFQGVDFTWVENPIILFNSRTTTSENGFGPWQSYCNNALKKFCLGGAAISCTQDSDCLGAIFEGFSTVYPPCIQIDGMTDSYGYPCRDQIGTGVTNTTTGAQALEPMWFWNNTWCYGANGVCTPTTPVTLYVNTDGSQNIIIKGRDYYESTNTALPGYVPYTYPHPLTGILSPPQNLRILQ